MQEFETSLGIGREAMPQIGSALQGRFITVLKDSGVNVMEVSADPSTLVPTQSYYSEDKVEAMKEKLLNGLTLGKADDGTRSLVSCDGYVLDGHHRYKACNELGLTLKVFLIDLGIKDLLDKARTFTSNIGGL